MARDASREAGPDDEWIRAARADLGSLREDSVAIPLARFIVTAGLYAIGLFGALTLGPLAGRIGAALLVGIAGGQLFLIGHDAAHGSYTQGRRLNAVIGRLALLPSLHAFALWQRAHRIHHRYTSLRDRDFVWTPLTKAEYDELGTIRRALERVYRSQFGLGLGLYYMIQIWLPRMVYPRRGAKGDRPASQRLDSAIVAVFVVALVSASWWLSTSAGNADDVASWLPIALVALVLPLLYVHWMIGFVVFFNHTHPSIPWFGDRREWSFWTAQLRCSAHHGLGRCPLLPNAVMSHTAHHFEPKVPTRRLRRAQRRLGSRFGGWITSYRPSLGELRRILHQCRLYDYANHRWLGFDGTPTAQVRLETPSAGIGAAPPRPSTPNESGAG